MKKADIEIKLHANIPIQIENLGMYQSLSLKQIAEIGEDEYNNILGHLLFDKDNLPHSESEEELPSTLQIVSTISSYDSDFKMVIERGIELFFGEKVSLFFSENEAFFYFGKIRDSRHFTDEYWESFCQILRLENHIQKEKKEELKFFDERARQQHERIQKAISGINKKAKNNLISIIHGMAWKSKNLNILDIWNLSLFQLYEGYKRMDFIGHYEDMMLGVYTGNIDSNKITFADIHWANVIQNK